MRVVLAWELGASLGHIARQAAIARELLRHGHELFIVARDLASLQGFVGDVPVTVMQAPVCQTRLRLNRPQICLAESLQLAGYRDTRSLWPLVQAWRAILDLTRADLVIADHAPTAMLAARCLNLSVLAIGNGFTLPEAGEPLADWRPGASNDDLVTQRDREVVAVINAMLPPERQLQGLSDLYRCERVIINSFAELDPYAAVRKCAEYCAGNPQDLPRRERFVHGNTPHVVAYLAPSYPRLRELCEGLAASPAEVLVCCPGAGPDLLNDVCGPRYTFIRELTDLEGLIAASDVFVGHAALGTLTQCLRHGKPMMLLPMQVEQLSNAIRVQKLGIGRICPEFRDGNEYSNALVAALQDRSAAQQALRFVGEHEAIARRTFAETVAQHVQRAASAA